MQKKQYKDLRSSRWFSPNDVRSFGHRSRAMQMGLGKDDWENKPIIGIINTWSEIQPCHQHFKQRVEDVKKGVYQSGGLPIELPAISLAEMYVKPTTMLYRNMLSMEVEELIRSHPIDGVVLMGGCDKTTPALTMGAISLDLPMIFLPAGPMLRGNYKGKYLGSGSDGWKYWDELRAGNITENDWAEVESGIARSYGHCMTMGTASTMTAIAEAIGLCLPGASSIPAADSNHIRMSTNVGKRIVDMVWEDLKPSKIITEKSIDNAVTVAMAMGCSTNAIIHLIAMARRAGIHLTIDDLDKKGREIPLIANIRPSGVEYLMEDFYYAGGILSLMFSLAEKLNLEEITVSGLRLKEIISQKETINNDVIRSLDNPIYEEGSLAVLKGNLAPDGCVIKPAACDKKFMKHKGPAIVFDSYQEMKDIIDSDDLDVSENHVLVLRNVGPVGGPGMPEWGMMPIPKKLLKKGVRDMVRISDARMSGTSYGACILHVAPESFIGGPLSLLKTGDIIELDVNLRKINMLVDDKTLSARKKMIQPKQPKAGRGWLWMFSQHVKQANEGCDFDFLETDFGKSAEEPDIY
ncbi:L-arabinonate dehydratase [Alphaproteobacteria bacterium]|jgi:dihydroxy-acid dehydratase|nr:L-arabinonate dehydratase [Alphaproteobacteria bacterium]MDA9914616.1 L-arabinonate dehydratase [Alphaproteobacteria bacterium]MDB2584487.1 L-arabinonate dehydratase [Alphaproteobacteria bacterium]MDB2684154.1 L-arabinonate dehydratase [Alphaproteobacteria bacterium]MDB3916607.1 L-arabinonate dehydratase [Alphaproteobacteria bacterium]